MALLQISEPGMSPAPHQRKYAVGIDLGTTHSLVAAVRNGNAVVLPDLQGRGMVPSVVHYGAHVTVGHEALPYRVNDAANTVVSIKRLMGRKADDVLQVSGQSAYEFIAREDGVPAIRTAAGNKTPVEVSADILKVLVTRAEQSLGHALHGAVITVPAYFDDAQRQATKDAATLAGIKVLRLLNEPTAAAVAYGLDKKDDITIAVYDLGGGTFDISILRLHEGVFEVRATGGDSRLGGDDIDHAIADWAMREWQLSELEPQQYRELIVACRQAKEDLFTQQEARITCGFGSSELLHDRARLADIARPFVERTLHACRQALQDAGLDVRAIDEVVMVGGSTRLAEVRQQVQQFFGKPLRIDINPDEIVALGAAIQADILVGNKPDNDLLLLDVIPLSLGIETMGGLVEKIIHRNTTLPVAMAQEFTTYKDGQTALSLHVVQGERELVADNRSLARFELRGIPPMAAGAARIRVTFQVDADGLLGVSARETLSGVESSIQVKPSYGLGDEQIAAMLKDSWQHAEADRDARALREQQVDADQLLETLAAALEADGEQLLSQKERETLQLAMSMLAAARNHDTLESLRQKTEALAQQSEFYAARRMDAAIRKALTGHTLEELDRGL